jgi:tRNA G18 (ribose-2'-O)-methylase SpoU
MIGMKKRVGLVRRPFFVVVHNIRSLHNVGAIFRTADGLGVDKVFLTGYTGHPPDTKISKVALGAEEVVPWEYKRFVTRLLAGLRVQYPDIVVIGLENNVAGTVVLDDLKLPDSVSPVVLVLGEETEGIPKNVLSLCDVLVEIPMRGAKESLNVSVAFGIAGYVLRRCL